MGGMVIDAMRINHGYLSENSCVEEKPDVDLVGFFYLLKDSNELLQNEYTNHNKLLVIAQVFIINENIIKWEKVFN